MAERKSPATPGPELDLLTEDLCSFAEVANELNVHVSSVHRWRLRGVHGTKLEAIRVGGKILTSWGAVTRFLNSIQESQRRKK